MGDGKKLFIDKDGNFLVLRTMIKHLLQYLHRQPIPNKRITIKVLVPLVGNREQGGFFSELENVASISNLITLDFQNMPWKLSPIHNRYHFDIDQWDAQLSISDIVFNNIPEITRNMRAILGDRKIPIVNFHHFCDYIQEDKLVTSWQNGNLFSYFWRQLDGYISGDFNVFNCAESRRGWHEAINYALSEVQALSTIRENCDFITTYTDVLGYIDSQTEAYFPELTALFNSRITESMYTNWDKVIRLFMNDNIKGECIMTNPSHDKGIRAIKKVLGDTFLNDYTNEIVYIDDDSFEVLRSPNGKLKIVSDKLTRQQYLKLAGMCQLAINLYENERYGGIAIREAIGYGASFPIVPDIFSYKKWFSDFDGGFDKVDDLSVEQYNALTSFYNTDTHKRILMHFIDCEHYGRYYEQMETLFKELFK